MREFTHRSSNFPFSYLHVRLFPSSKFFISCVSLASRLNMVFVKTQLLEDEYLKTPASSVSVIAISVQLFANGMKHCFVVQAEKSGDGKGVAAGVGEDGCAVGSGVGVNPGSGGTKGQTQPAASVRARNNSTNASIFSLLLSRFSIQLTFIYGGPTSRLTISEAFGTRSVQYFKYHLGLSAAWSAPIFTS